MSSYLGAGMVLNEEKRARLADALAHRQGALGVAGASAPSAPVDSAHSAPTPAPSAPIAAIPLATTRASPMLTPLKKNKGVVAIDLNNAKTLGRGSSLKGEGWLPL